MAHDTRPHRSKATRDALALTVARMRHERQMTAVQIGDALDTSERDVNYLMHWGRRKERPLFRLRVENLEPEGTVNDPLSDELKLRLECEHATVVDIEDLQWPAIDELDRRAYDIARRRLYAGLGPKAARLLKGLVRPDDVLGLGPGAAVGATVRGLTRQLDAHFDADDPDSAPPTWIPDGHICSLSGRLSPSRMSHVGWDSDDTANELREHLGLPDARLHRVDTPLIVRADGASRRRHEAYDAAPYLVARDGALELTVCVFGLGTLGPGHAFSAIIPLRSRYSWSCSGTTTSRFIPSHPVASAACSTATGSSGPTRDLRRSRIGLGG